MLSRVEAGVSLKAQKQATGGRVNQPRLNDDSLAPHLISVPKEKWSARNP